MKATAKTQRALRMPKETLCALCVFAVNFRVLQYGP
jgi:hypothetical protein